MIKDIKKEDIERLVDNGFSTRDIAKELGIAQTTARYYLKRFNLKTRGSSLVASLECKNCGKSLKDLPTRIGSFCCSSCKFKYYTQNPSGKANGYYKNRYIKNKVALINYAGGKCVKCGHDKLCSLDFHHRNPEDKSFEINAQTCIRFSLDNLKKEADKCDLVCANCHRAIHYADLAFSADEILNNLTT